MEEKNLIQERMEKHGMEVASLEARLDEFRRLDPPQCAALQQKITTLSEEIEKLRTDLIKVTLEVSTVLTYCFIKLLLHTNLG